MMYYVIVVLFPAQRIKLPIYKQFVIKSFLWLIIDYVKHDPTSTAVTALNLAKTTHNLCTPPPGIINTNSQTCAQV